MDQYERNTEYDALRARHVATQYLTHCDECSLRWPCDIALICQDFDELQDKYEAALRALNQRAGG